MKFLFPIILQAICLVIASLFLDGGKICNLFIKLSLIFWIIILITECLTLFLRYFSAMNAMANVSTKYYYDITLKYGIIFILICTIITCSIPVQSISSVPKPPISAPISEEKSETDQVNSEKLIDE